MALFDRFRPRRVLHAVVPIVISAGKEQQDLQRAQILFASLRAGFNHRQCLQVHVVGRASELAQIEAALRDLATPWLQFSFHDELALVPDLHDGPNLGWLKQQIVKMAAAEWLDADFWLTFDADVVCVRRFGIDDLFVNGRAILRTIPTADVPLFAAWVRDSGQALGYGAVATDHIVDMTPVLYSRDAMRRVFAAISAASGKPWRQGLYDYLKESYRPGGVFAGWAEMALYLLVLEREGVLRQYHAVNGVDTERRLMADGSIWTPEAWPDWQPPAMDATNPGYFIVCGSHTEVPVEVVHERIAPVIAKLDRRFPLPPLFTPAAPPPAAAPVAPTAPAAAPAAPVAAVASPDVLPSQLKIYARVISRQPLIVMGALQEWDKSFVSPTVLRCFRDIPAHFLLVPYWSIADMAAAKAAAQALAERHREFPNHSFFILCNSPQELQNFRHLGVPCGLFNHNIFVDQSVFRPMPEIAKRFDAVYNAGLVGWKRQSLARDVPSLELLFAPWHQDAHTEDYVKSLRTSLAHAAFVNQPTPQDAYRFLLPDQVARHVNEARVGLCLSAVEGAMYASVEYLLCGLPIVSTPSEGGRDVLFDFDHTILVEPEPRAVADGVARMIARNLSPQDVRDRVLAKIVRHRQNFLQLIEQIYAVHQAPWPPQAGITALFSGTVLKPMSLFQLERQVLRPDLPL